MLPGVRMLFLGACFGLVACSYGSDGDFGDSSGGGAAGGASGRPGTPGGGSSGARQPGDPPPATCGDGTKNGGEADVDCGGPCDTKCADGAGCASAVDCGGGACAGGVCQPPSGTDGIKNGDETDLDCGGVTTGAPRCAQDKTCVQHTDCASNGCRATGTCADAPSCVAHFGADTCGHGEVGSGDEQHESCCTTVPFPGYAEADHPGQQVSIDRYEITAGRVREWMRRIAEAYGGEPNVRQWVQEHRPVRWDDSWTALLPQDLESGDGVYAQFSAYGDDDQGFHIHGMNCNQATGSYGSSTYWLPADIEAQYAGGNARAASQDELDVKAMSCITNVMAAAFCAWDGGQLVTLSALYALTNDGFNIPHQTAGTIQIYIDGGNAFGEPLAYEYPAGGGDDGAGRVSPGGRLDADVFTGAGGGIWHDLAGNLNEMTLDDGAAFRLANHDPFQAPVNDNPDPTSRILGIGYGSAVVQLAEQGIDNFNAARQPNYKSGLSGARCMRFQ